MIIHYNCTIVSFLLHYFLLIYHPYPTSFHEMIFILVYIESDMSVLQFSCCLHHMESLKTKSRLRISRAELAMRNGQCIILCNMCVLFVFSTHT